MARRPRAAARRQKQPGTVKLCARCPVDLHVRLKCYAACEHRDIELVVLDALRVHLEGFYPSVPIRLRRPAPLEGDTPPAADGGLTAA
jgi:hypothetical protein